MKRELLTDQFNYLEDGDLCTLNVGAGTIEVWENESDAKPVTYKLSKAMLDIVKYAYERGLKTQSLF